MFHPEAGFWAAVIFSTGLRVMTEAKAATADMLLTRDWRIEGQFREGALSDPALPGTVTAIAGHWSALPESDRAVVRVDAGEALLTANRPANDAERPLFHPLRLNSFAAVLRDGNIDAQGAVVAAFRPGFAVQDLRAFAGKQE